MFLDLLAVSNSARQRIQHNTPYYRQLPSIIQERELFERSHRLIEIMGNGLRKAVGQENWWSVEQMLLEPRVQERLRTKRYRSFSKEGEAAQSVNLLHLVLQKSVPVSILEKVLDIAPLLVRSCALPSGELPLHFALRFHKNGPMRQEIVAMLIEKYPQSAMEQSSNGRTPLHIACESKCSVEMIELVHSKFPGAADLPDESGQLPWKVFKKATRPWNIFYRRRVRKIIYRPGRRQARLAVAAGNDEAGRQIDVRQSHRFTRSTKNADDFHSCRSEEVDGASSSTEDDEGNTTGYCILCWDGIANHVLIPCGHICLCQKCSNSPEALHSLKMACPVCKKNYTRAPMRVYHAGIVAPAD